MKTILFILAILLNLIGTILLAKDLLSSKPKQIVMHIFSPDEIEEKQEIENKKHKRRLFWYWFGFILLLVSIIIQVIIAYNF